MNASSNPFVRRGDELRRLLPHERWVSGQFKTTRGMTDQDAPSQIRLRSEDDLRRRRPLPPPTCIVPVGVSITCDIANPIPPHSTVIVTSVWNAFTTGPVPTYQWKIGGLNLPEGAKYINTQTAVLTVTDFTAANNQTYTAFAMGKCGTARQDILLTT